MSTANDFPSNPPPLPTNQLIVCPTFSPLNFSKIKTNGQSEGKKWNFQTFCSYKWQLIDDEHTFTRRCVCLLFESTRKVKSGWRPRHWRAPSIGRLEIYPKFDLRRTTRQRSCSEECKMRWHSIFSTFLLKRIICSKSTTQCFILFENQSILVICKQWKVWRFLVQICRCVCSSPSWIVPGRCSFVCDWFQRRIFS